MALHGWHHTHAKKSAQLPSTQLGGTSLQKLPGCCSAASQAQVKEEQTCAAASRQSWHADPKQNTHFAEERKSKYKVTAANAQDCSSSSAYAKQSGHEDQQDEVVVIVGTNAVADEWAVVVHA